VQDLYGDLRLFSLGKRRLRGNLRQPATTSRGATKMMEPNPAQQGPAATSCGLGGSYWTLGRALPPGDWCCTGTSHPGWAGILPPQGFTRFG